jgi:NADH dehydrogenase FAD-containing subunit
VIGDIASLDQDGKPLPGVAQVAMHQGRYVGKLIHNRVIGKPAPRSAEVSTNAGQSFDVSKLEVI